MKVNFNRFTQIILCVSLMQGCGALVQIPESELDWDPVELLSDACPNLNGRYAFRRSADAPTGENSNGFIPVYAGHFEYLYTNSKTDPATGKERKKVDWQKIPDYQTIVAYDEQLGDLTNPSHRSYSDIFPLTFRIQQTPDFITQQVSDQRGIIVTNLGTKMAGCANGAVVFRYLNRFGGVDFVSQGVQYGEFKLRKLANGDLRVAKSVRLRERSPQGVLGPVISKPGLIKIYPSFSPR